MPAAGGGLGPVLGDACSGECLLMGGCLPGPRGVPAWFRGGGVVSKHTLRQTPRLGTESQTPVKILPYPNFVAGGKN